MAHFEYMLLVNSDGHAYRVDEIEENETVFQSDFEFATEVEAERAAQAHIKDLEDASDAT